MVDFMTQPTSIKKVYTKRGVASRRGIYVPTSTFGYTRHTFGQLSPSSILTAIGLPLVIAGGAAAIAWWMISAMGKTAKGTAGFRGLQGISPKQLKQRKKFKWAARNCKGLPLLAYRNCMKHFLKR